MNKQSYSRMKLIVSLLLVMWLAEDASAASQNQIRVSVTCDNTLYMYADGQIVVNGAPTWTTTDHVSIDADTAVVAIKCVDLHVVAGIIASFSDGTVTDNSWKCTSTTPAPGWKSAGFDDSAWQTAYEIHQNNSPSPYWGTRTGISSSASWIWTRGWRGQDKVVYCRKQLKETDVCDDSIAACEECELDHGVGYVADCDDQTVFHQCVLQQDNTFSMTSMQCPSCTLWNQTLLTCVRDWNDRCASDNSVSQTPVITVVNDRCFINSPTGVVIMGSVQGDQTKYKLYTQQQVYTMPCAAGTSFNLTQCTCTDTHVRAEVVKFEICINFETMKSTDKYGFNDNKTWISNHGSGSWNEPHVQLETGQCQTGAGNCALFDDTLKTYLAINSLANSFHTWPAFTISLNFMTTYTKPMGIFTNGVTDCGAGQPSVSMTTQNGYVTALVYMQSGAYASVTGKTSMVNWNHVSLSWDSNTVYLSINGAAADQRTLTGSLRQSHCPMIFGQDMNGVFYDGYMDEICLFKTATVNSAPAA